MSWGCSLIPSAYTAYGQVKMIITTLDGADNQVTASKENSKLTSDKASDEGSPFNNDIIPCDWKAGRYSKPYMKFLKQSKCGCHKGRFNTCQQK